MQIVGPSQDGARVSNRIGGAVQRQFDIFVGEAPDVLAAGLIAGGYALSALWAIEPFIGVDLILRGVAIVALG
jgi:hypothetical protein